LLNTKSKY